MTKKVSALGERKVAMDWRSIYALIGETLDEVAGRSCADFKIKFTTDKLHTDHPVFGRRAVNGHAIAKHGTARIHVPEPDEYGDWLGKHYCLLFHELGHLVWYTAAPQLREELVGTVEWLAVQPHLYAAATRHTAHQVADLLISVAIDTWWSDFEEMLAEYQADVFALRVATRLGMKYRRDAAPLWAAHREAWRRAWSDARPHNPLILLSLWRAQGDLKQVAREACELTHWKFFEWMEQHSWLKRSEWYRIREELARKMEKRWGMSADECPDRAEWQYQYLRNAFWRDGRSTRFKTFGTVAQMKREHPAKCFPRRSVRRGEQRFRDLGAKGWIRDDMPRRIKQLTKEAGDGHITKARADQCAQILETLVGFFERGARARGQ